MRLYTYVKSITNSLFILPQQLFHKGTFLIKFTHCVCVATSCVHQACQYQLHAKVQVRAGQREFVGENTNLVK